MLIGLLKTCTLVNQEVAMRRSRRKQIIQLPKTDPEVIQYVIPTRKVEEVPVFAPAKLPEPKKERINGRI